MRVVHVVAKDSGGAARAALRINEALKLIGVDSSVLVLYKEGNDDSVHSVFSNKISFSIFKVIRKINNKLTASLKLDGKFYYAKVSVPLYKIDCVKKADVINLHWVNDGMMSSESIEILNNMLGKKIVWTMHDMFAFTAGCYYDNNCGEYIEKCEECKLISGNDVKFRRIVRKQYERKAMLYKNVDVAFIGCSNWIASCAKASSLLGEHLIQTIPNPINNEKFYPMDKKASVQEFDIITNKKIILFGAMSSDSDERKGFRYLKEALRYLNPEKYLIVVFGNDNDNFEFEKEFQVFGVGRINSDEKLVKLYSMADVFIAPSIQENLSNAVMESLACGTPVAAFRIGGMPDMICDGITGYLATPFDSKNLAECIERCAYGELEQSCVKFVQQHFVPEMIGKKYLDFYKKVIENR